MFVKNPAQNDQMLGFGHQHTSKLNRIADVTLCCHHSAITGFISFYWPAPSHNISDSRHTKTFSLIPDTEGLLVIDSNRVPADLQMGCFNAKFSLSCQFNLLQTKV